jgi:hypothetical protein
MPGRRRTSQLALLLAALAVAPACADHAAPGDGASVRDGGSDAAVDAPAGSPDAARQGCVDHPGWTLGLLRCDPTRAAAGHTLLAPLRRAETYLVDRRGRLVHSWSGTLRPGMASYLLEDGTLLRAARQEQLTFEGSSGAGGRVQRLSWEGKLLWDYTYADDQRVQHHDVAALPGGNVVLLAWERKSVAEAVAAGRDPAQLSPAGLWVDHLVEVKPKGLTGGEIVWEWHLWDHLIQDHDPAKANHGVVASHPELLDINFDKSTRADWMHVNAVAYNAQLDQLVISAGALGELYVIDHGTTTAEAKGHTGGKRGRGGDLLYRWGNPAAYRAGKAGDRVFYTQHDAHWIPAGLPGGGDLLVFNNGVARSGGQDYSTVDQLTPPLGSSGGYALAPGAPYGPASLAWRYQGSPPTSFASRTVSGAQRLPGGTTLICEGDNGRLFEVTAKGELVWEYINPVSAKGPLPQGTSPAGQSNNLFKARRYPPGYAGLKGRSLVPQGYLELPAP